MKTQTYNEYMELIEKHQIDYPVNVEIIAKELGIKVFYSDIGDVSGAIAKKRFLEENKILDKGTNDFQYVCLINQKHSKTRQRFTLAHEIAHYILHKDLIGDGIQEDALLRSSLSNQTEVEANKLAASILMPWSLINKAIRNGINKTEELAKAFNVSLDAMSVRTLGYPHEAIC